MTVRVIYNDFPKLARRTGPSASKVLEGVATQIARDVNAAAPSGGSRHAKQPLKRSYRAQPDRSADQPTWLVYTTNWYAWMVEFGVTQAPAQPHLLPAAERGRRQLVSNMARQFEGGLG